MVHLGALQWKDRKKKQKKKKITSHNVIGTGDLGFNIFIKPLPSWMPDEKDLSPLSWHVGFLEFHYSFSSSSFIFRRLNNVETLFKYLSLVKQKIHYTQGVKLPVPSNAIFLSASCYFSACLQIITRALIAADEEAPPLNSVFC